MILFLPTLNYRECLTYLIPTIPWLTDQVYCLLGYLFHTGHSQDSEPLCHKNYRYIRPIRIITDTESGKFDDFFDCPKSQAAAIDQYLQHPNDETGADGMKIRIFNFTQFQKSNRNHLDFVFAQIDDGKNELPVAPEDRQPRPDSPTSGNEEDIESTASNVVLFKKIV